MTKWAVRKVDDSWNAIDPGGEPTFTSRTWIESISYALMAADRTADAQKIRQMVARIDDFSRNLRRHLKEDE